MACVCCLCRICIIYTYQKSKNKCFFFVAESEVADIWDYFLRQYNIINHFLNMRYIYPKDLAPVDWALYKDLKSMPHRLE